MKHLKLYESFRSDFKEDLNSAKHNYETQVEKIKQDIKQKVDDYMFDILDEYQTHNDSFVKINTVDDTFEITYNNIVCKLSEIDNFLKLIRDVSDVIEKQLELSILFWVTGNYTGDDGDVDELDFTIGKLTFSHVMNEIDSLKHDVSLFEIDSDSSKYSIELSIFVHS